PRWTSPSSTRNSPPTYLEAVVQAAERTRGDAAIGIEGLVIPHALVLPEDGRVTVQLVLADSGGRAAFSYHSRQRDTGEWGLHARGPLVPAGRPNSRADLDAILARCPDRIEGTSFYRSLWQRKLHLGPS